MKKNKEENKVIKYMGYITILICFITAIDLIFFGGSYIYHNKLKYNFFKFLMFAIAILGFLIAMNEKE